MGLRVDYRRTLDRIKRTSHAELQYIAFRSGVSFFTLRGIKYDKTGRFPGVPLIEKVARGFKRAR